ncbi:glycosyltransferase [Desulfoprunum benzoelyticum]|uniref:Glycosyltransferase involved in cell wall biosynthesis n=1 Tax=Desulfoprunum benzoelyticum TaxID=1506996 RepID=A0A840UYL0_9BACT|nr:glycosyltransferase involved in cell wall biosynthesis [Desulfoprunum benzoelyticum]MBM9528881.1 glycosyltransferase [Desulfoprunum benzoelyticum]
MHYIRGGWREGRCPGPLFDIGYYNGQPTEEEAGASEPVQHFISKGWRRGKKPNPLFDPLFYARENGDLDFTGIDPLSHFISKGWREGRQPRPYFDPLYYLQQYQDVAAGGLDPLSHYLQIGRGESRRTSLYFDPAWYIDRTPVLADSAEDILLHYDEYGIREGKSPIPVFDPLFYRASLEGEIGEAEDPLAHYLRSGEKEGRRPCPWFDPVYYRERYLGDGSVSSLGHYLAEGVSQGLYPNRKIAELPQKPTISVIVPVCNAAAHHLNNCIRSVLHQSYPHWQLCLADDGSTQAHVRPLLEEWAARDQRIRIIFLETNRGIAGATNAAAALAEGDYLSFLGSDDELAPECLFRIVQAAADTGADLLYTDEDLIGDDGRRFSVFHKPDYNPELLLCHNYVTHFVATARKLWHEVGGCADDKSGAQDYDLFLRLSEKARQIVHLPEILYHWRASETSTSIDHSRKEYAAEAGRRSVVDALQRREIEGEVLPTEFKYYYRVKRELYLLPLLSLVVRWTGDRDGLREWIGNLVRRTEYSNYEMVLVVDQDIIDPGLEEQLLTLDQPVRLIVADRQGGLAAHYNDALAHCDGDYVVFVRDDLAINDGYWLSALVEYCQRPDTGIVAGRVDGDDADVPEVTPIPDIDNDSPRYYARFLQQASVLLNGLHCPQNVWAPSWDCCAVNRDLFDACNGFDAARFPDLFAMHDLGFKCLAAGFKSYSTPYCRLRLHGDRRNASTGTAESWKREQEIFQGKWRAELAQGDPYYNRGRVQEAGIDMRRFVGWFAGADS